MKSSVSYSGACCSNCLKIMCLVGPRGRMQCAYSSDHQAQISAGIAARLLPCAEAKANGMSNKLSSFRTSTSIRPYDLGSSSNLKIIPTMASPPSTSIRSTCHCGAITATVPRVPEYINHCQCTICRRYGVAWGYYHPDEVKLDKKPNTATRQYIWGDRELEFHFCDSCGCV